ncbi:MAG: matrixin family metalloprotease [Planctomycetaceae bacterium]|nr:matrixin family metalloprotease [Planctomycetaceae bacterium]
MQIAFNKWQDHIGVRVRFVKKEEAANVIVKVLELDGQGGKLAEATVGPGPGGSVVSDLFIDRSEVWTPDKFQATICHEVGHLLGLEHIESADALMFGTLQYAGNLPKFIEPQSLDIMVAEQKWGPAIP